MGRQLAKEESRLNCQDVSAFVEAGADADTDESLIPTAELVTASSWPGSSIDKRGHDESMILPLGISPETAGLLIKRNLTLEAGDAKTAKSKIKIEYRAGGREIIAHPGNGLRQLI